MATDSNYPLLLSIVTGIGGGLSYVGKKVSDLIISTIAREGARADRLEQKLFDTQSLIYPVLEEANSAIREAIARKEQGHV